MPASAASIDSASRNWLLEQAQAAGFDLAGLTTVPEDVEDEDARLESWLAAGNAGDMTPWLARTDAEGQLLRGDIRRHLPWARSVLVCALNYNAVPTRSVDPAPPTTGWIARYAWSGRTSAPMDDAAAPQASDYHDVLLDKLRRIEAALLERFPAARTHAYVDTGPLQERSYAVRAGLGWIAKNTCVIHPRKGSWLLLACLVTSLELLPESVVAPLPDRCGTCTRCIDACPTACIHTPTPEDPTRRLDATRCIAYLTIEHKGAIAEELRPAIGRNVFGCDICQDVCPWNRKAPIALDPALPPRRSLINPDLAWLASLNGPEFNRWFRHSPLERTRRRRLLRNVAIAMGNSADPAFRPHLEALAAEPDPALAEAAQWALARLAQP